MNLPSLPQTALPPEILIPFLEGLAFGPHMVVLYDADDVIRYANQAFCSAYIVDGKVEITFEEMIRRAFAHGIGSIPWHTDVDAFLQDVGTRRRCAPLYECAVNLVTGRWVWLTETLLANDWLLTIGTDITALKQSEKSLRQAHGAALRAAWTDSLTGLPNRRRVFDFLREALDDARKRSVPLSIAMIDLDHFKSINDRVGHAGGDLVLKHFAEACSAHLRAGEVIGRIGGEEFLVILPGCSLDDAVNLMEALRARLAISELPECMAGKKYTISAGLATAEHNDSIDSIMPRADIALYAAKRGGRDQVQRWLAGASS